MSLLAIWLATFTLDLPSALDRAIRQATGLEPLPALLVLGATLVLLGALAGWAERRLVRRGALGWDLAVGAVGLACALAGLLPEVPGLLAVAAGAPAIGFAMSALRRGAVAEPTMWPAFAILPLEPETIVPEPEPPLDEPDLGPLPATIEARAAWLGRNAQRPEVRMFVHQLVDGQDPIAKLRERYAHDVPRLACYLQASGVTTALAEDGLAIRCEHEPEGAQRLGGEWWLIQTDERPDAVYRLMSA